MFTAFILSNTQNRHEISWIIFASFNPRRKTHGDKDKNCHICALECDSKPKLRSYFVEVWNSVQNSSTLKVQSVKLILSLCHFLGFTGVSDGKESACNVKRPTFDPWVGKILRRREWQSTPVVLPGEFHGERRLAGYSSWGCK